MRITSTHPSGVAHAGRAIVLAAGLLFTNGLFGAGILTPTGSSDLPVEILDHHVDVRITDGFARTMIQQTFHNPNPHDVEALYAFPVPESASLSEITIRSGEKVLEGEVIPKEEARRIYEEEKSKGNDAGLGSKESYQRFEFRVFPVRPQTETFIEVVYYQPLSIDLGVGRYVYPIEEGGTDEQAESFWTRNDEVLRAFSAEVTVRSGYPLDAVRVTGFPGEPVREDEQTWKWSFHSDRGTLNKDLVVYYRLAENLPGRVDLLTYRPDGADPGYFLLTVTPGIDLEPITHGTDYLFILDTSGSMSGKIATLTAGIEQALGRLRPGDRARVVTFSDKAADLTPDWVDLEQRTAGELVQEVRNLSAGGSTNLYAGLQLGLRHLDADRPTNVILVTDGVTNTGVIDPGRFHELLKERDIRLFGFLLGNSANWPLMRVICEATDGFYAPVSNADDLVGKILQARDKITFEALLDVDLGIKGVRVSEVTRDFSGKVFRGQQLTLFGRYDRGGEADLRLTTRKTTGDLAYATTFDFPEVDTRHPELERLWAMNRIEEIELQRDIGRTTPAEAKDGIRDLGVAYQLVTDETSMLVLDTDGFERHGIERHNQERIARERAAQAARQTAPVANRADTNQPLFAGNAPRIFGGGGGGGGGAFGLEALGLAGLAAAGHWFRKRRKGQS